MALEVEDGTGMIDSQSYVSVAELKAYATARLIVLPSLDSKAIEAALLKAMDYLESKVCFKGEIVLDAQALSWPRKYVIIDNKEFAIDAIPKKLKLAQILLAIESMNGVDLMPTLSAQDYVIKEKVGPLETEYADPSKVGLQRQFTAVDALLAGLIGSECGHGGYLTVYRV